MDPDKFIPDRWLEPDSGRLDKYMVSFYRGTRQCLGKEYVLRFLFGVYLSLLIGAFQALPIASYICYCRIFFAALISQSTTLPMPIWSGSILS